MKKLAICIFGVMGALLFSSCEALLSEVGATRALKLNSDRQK